MTITTVSKESHHSKGRKSAAPPPPAVSKLIRIWLVLSRIFGIWDPDMTPGKPGRTGTRCAATGFKATVLLLSWVMCGASLQRIYVNLTLAGDRKLLDHGKFLFLWSQSTCAGWILTMAFIYRRRHAEEAREFVNLTLVMSPRAMSYLRKVSYIILVTFIPLILSPIWGYAVIFSQRTYQKNFAYLFNPVVMTFMVASSLLMSSVIMYFVSAYCFVCITLAQRITDISETLTRSQLQGYNSGGIMTDVTNTVREFEKIFQLISRWNESIASIVLMLFFFGTLLILSNTYSLVFDDNFYNKITYGFIIFGVLFIYTNLILPPDLLNKKMEDLCRIVNGCCNEGLPGTDGSHSSSVPKLMRLLNCSQINKRAGCTMFNCFTLDRKQILAIISCVLTYLIVLVQFHVSGL